MPNSYPSVYKWNCDCGGKWTGETKKCVLNQSINQTSRR